MMVKAGVLLGSKYPITAKFWEKLRAVIGFFSLFLEINFSIYFYFLEK